MVVRYEDWEDTLVNAPTATPLRHNVIDPLTHLQLPTKDGIEGRARNDPKFSLLGNLASKGPGRNADSHASLNDTGNLVGLGQAEERKKSEELHEDAMA